MMVARNAGGNIVQWAVLLREQTFFLGSKAVLLRKLCRPRIRLVQLQQAHLSPVNSIRGASLRRRRAEEEQNGNRNHRLQGFSIRFQAILEP